MKTLFVGSNNLNKITEIKEICKKNGIELNIKCPKDFNDDSNPIEDGISFEENAYIKAKYYYDRYRMPCIAEDSGICIEYLNNLPCIHSKRFMSQLNDRDKNEYVLKLMDGIKNRKAVFHTVICYIDLNGKSHFFYGTNEGEISLKQAGEEGFGYDPIFYIPSEGKTEAELGNDYKNEHSHRAKAFRELIKYFINEEK